jgi:putative endonuclease
MAESHNLGKKGEDIAAGHLEKAGYKILKRNWTAGKHEVDIIAENKDYIVFVEVKTRSEDFLVPPASAVTREKQRSLIFCADRYIQRYGVQKECRFDVITVISSGESFRIEHIENAFYPTLR